jgi:hypothetical protein
MTEAERALLIAVAQAVLLRLEHSEVTGYTALKDALAAVAPGAERDLFGQMLLARADDLKGA